MSIRFAPLDDDTGDARAPLQAALDAAAGDELILSPGRYVVGPGDNFWSLEIPPNTRVVGDGDVVVAQGRCAGSRRIVLIRQPGVTLENISFDGQSELQGDVDEHRAAVFVDGATHLVMRAITASQFTGDGVYVRGGRTLWFDSVALTHNGRNGLTFGGQTDDVLVVGAHLMSNGAQQLDTEAPTASVNDFMLRDSVLGGGPDYALTISGGGETQRSKRWVVMDNVLNGGVNIVWAEDVLIRNNEGYSDDKSIRVYRTCRDVTICDNNFESTVSGEEGVVSVVGTESGAPAGTLITRNVLRGVGRGVTATGAGDVEISHNEIIGHGVGDGVWLRATSALCEFRLALVDDNRIRGWSRGVAVYGSGAAKLDYLEVRRNRFRSLVTGSLDLNADDLNTVSSVNIDDNVVLDDSAMWVRGPEQFVASDMLVPRGNGE